MPKVSVIIPTCNRPELLSRAIQSVLDQTYQDFEIIVVDDGDVKSAEDVVRRLKSEEVRPPDITQFGEVGPRLDISERIKYIKHEQRKGGAAARNTGIKAAKGEFIAFLDDDDEWLPEKLKIQMKEFENTPRDVGFCFSAVKNIYKDKEETSKVPEGANDYHELALRRLKGFLTVTLVIKKYVFDEVGAFDENLPSHQEPDLMIRVSKKFKGLGINKALVRVSMSCSYEHVGGSIKRRIAGREIILSKYFDEFKKRPEVLAYHCFQLGLWCRDDGQKDKAKEYFKKAWQTNFNLRYFLHYLRMFYVHRI